MINENKPKAYLVEVSEHDNPSECASFTELNYAIEFFKEELRDYLKDVDGYSEQEIIEEIEIGVNNKHWIDPNNSFSVSMYQFMW